MAATVMSNASNGQARSNSTGTDQASAPQRQRRFMLASFEHTELGETRQLTLGTNPQQLSFRVPTYGYIDTLFLRVTATTAGNAAATAFNADAPWNLFRSVLFRDATGNPIQNMSGYNMYLAQKYGGYRLWRPEANTQTYNVTTGAGATGGSFTFYLPIRATFGRDGLGLLPNMDASAQYGVDVTIGTLTDVYSTAPTSAPAITVQLVLLARSNPPAVGADSVGNVTTPFGNGTVQYWSSNQQQVSVGNNTILLPRVGNYIRNQFLIFRSAAGVRQDVLTQISGAVQVEYDASILYQENSQDVIKRAYDLYGFDIDTGILPYPRTADPDYAAAAEYGDNWLPTRGSTKLAWRFTAAAAGTVDVITNDVIPIGNVFV